MSTENTEHYFLLGGGEMGELIRAKDWSSTALGDPEEWPQSLRTMVAVMLDNPFGMYIAWGKDYIQLYNDGYRPILGSTKHPQALGISTRETFAEIWHIIESMFDGVMEGKAVGFPDFMLPLNRNGFVEECYFDFSYSPIRKENGEVGGVLVTVIETTEKKKAEAALKDSELRFRTMADNIPNLAWMADAAGWIYWYNKKWYEYTGTTYQQMEGWGWQSVHDPKELPWVVRKWQQSLTSGEPFEMVFPLKGADGTFRQFLTRVLPVKNDEGEIYQWFGTNTDITEQKEAEEALKESEERFRTMAESTDILIAVGDETSNAIYFNKAWVELTGRKMEDLLQFGWVDLVHPEEREHYVNLYLDSFQKKIAFTGEFRVLSKNGQYRWILAKCPPRIRPDGTFAGYISSCVDITDFKLADEIVRESEKRFRSLTESIPQLVWETDEKGNQLFASRRWEEYTGISTGGEAEWRAVVHPDDYDHNVKTWMHSLATGEHYRCDVRIKSKHGEYRWHTAVGAPVFDKENKIVKWVGAFTDIHSEKGFTRELEKEVENRTNELEKANKNLESKNKELERMNKELQSFAYISSHDLQEPLRKIQTFSTQLIDKEYHNLSENGRDKFHRMQKSAERMQRLIEDLLAYSRTNAVEKIFEEVDLEGFIEEIREDLKEELVQKNGTIEVIEICKAQVIPFQFRQLMYNLISNSLKFSDENHPPHIKVKCKIDTGSNLNNDRLLSDVKYCHISVSDNGIGFEQQYSEKIFEVFQRLHGKNQYVGTGIGLAIVKKIVDNHNGIITAKSELHKGATFDIYFPVP